VLKHQLIVVIIVTLDVVVLKRIVDHIVFEVVDLVVIDNVDYDENVMNVDDVMVVIDNNHAIEVVDVDNLDLLHPYMHCTSRDLYFRRFDA